ncbi:MAG: MATE family efflux transporter [Cyclobacteriaceae bacterium]
MNKTILKLAIPNILSNLTIPLLSFVDTSIVGHLALKEYLAAVSVGGSVFIYLYGSLIILRMATTGLSAQLFGRKDQKELNQLLMQGVGIAAVLGVLLVIFRYQLFNIGIQLIEPSPEVVPHAEVYVGLRLIAAPATLINFVISGWFLGIQQPKKALLLSVLVSGGNTLFSYVLVFVYNMEIAGVALGSAMGQYLGLIVSIFLVIKTVGIKELPFSLQIFKWSRIQRYFTVGTDLFFRSLIMMTVFTFFRVQYTQDHIDIAAANLLLIEMFLFMTFSVDGFALVAESLTGAYIGEGNTLLLKKSIHYLLVWCIASGLLFSMVYVLFGNSILSIMTNKQEIVVVAKEYLSWLYALPVVCAIPFLWDGVFIGITKTRILILIVGIGAILFFSTYFSLRDNFGNHALWLALFVFFVFRASFQTVLAKWKYKLI